MKRLFSILAVVAALMILMAGGGAYQLSSHWVSQAKKEAAAIKAKSFTLSLAAQIEQLNKALEKMSQDPDLLTAVTTADPVLLATVTNRLEHYLPYVLKIRVLFPNVSQLDETSVPRMGYADLDMVQKTFSENQSPSVQGDDSKDKHVAITRKIKQGDTTVAVILASLNDSFLHKSIEVKNVDRAGNDSIELMQDKRLLAVSGKQPIVESDDIVQVEVANTNWLLLYHYDSYATWGEIGMILVIIFVALLVALLTCLFIQHKLSSILTTDLLSIGQASKDLLKNKAQGSYPTHLSETSNIIMELMQFKRVLDSRKEESTTTRNVPANFSDEHFDQFDSFDSADIENFFDD